MQILEIFLLFEHQEQLKVQIRSNQIKSIEYACKHLGCPLVVILGHTKCGTLAAALEIGSSEGKLGILLNNLKGAVKYAENLRKDNKIKEEEKMTAALTHYIDHSRKSILKRSPILRELVETGQIKIIGGIYDILTGQVEFRENFTIGLSDYPVCSNSNAIHSLNFLIQGNNSFLASHCPKELLTVLSSTKPNPFAIILSCSDSRIPVELIFHVGFGDLFVIRVVGPVYGPEVIGSIEYAVAHLGCRLLLIMGHTKCAFIKAALEGSPDHNMFNDLTEKLHESVAAASCFEKYKEEATLLYSVDNLKTTLLQKSHLLAKYVSNGTLKIAGAVYFIRSGEIFFRHLSSIYSTSKPIPPPLSPEKSLQIIQEGNQRFIAGLTKHFPAPSVYSTGKNLRPIVLFLTCTDSFRKIEAIFDIKSVDIVVLRSTNIQVGHHEIASLEYYSSHLDCPLIIVLGHTSCQNLSFSENEKSISSYRQSIEETKNELLKRSTILQHPVNEGKLKFFGCIFNHHTKLVQYI